MSTKLALFLAWLAVAAAPRSARAWMPGDLTGDAKVNVTDVQVMIQVVLSNLGNNALPMAIDGNQDGVPDGLVGVGDCGPALVWSPGGAGDDLACFLNECFAAADPCDDGDACTVDSCDPAQGCQHAPGLDCNDGNPCNGVEFCDLVDGCKPGAAVTCDDGSSCTIDACDPAIGCVYKPWKPTNCCGGKEAPGCQSATCEACVCEMDPFCCNTQWDDICAGEASVLCSASCDCAGECSDGDACTVDDSCFDGACVGGAHRNCNDGYACTAELCDPSVGCVVPIWALNVIPGEECMMTVPEGTFWMGANFPEDGDCLADEFPGHAVYLDAFQIDVTEVTRSAYKACETAGGCNTIPPAPAVPNIASHPVVGVSWSEAQTYCSWAGKRLCTEAEWEKAARGDDGFVYPWGSNKCPTSYLAKMGGTGGLSPPYTAVVGSYPWPYGSSPYGVLDMAGNAEEWVADWYGAYPPDPPPITFNPQGPATGTQRVLRGGSYNSNANHLRTSARAHSPGVLYPIGFRCCRSVPQ